MKLVNICGFVFSVLGIAVVTASYFGYNVSITNTELFGLIISVFGLSLILPNNE